MSADWRQFAMTVGELRERLTNLPADMPVILEKDAEGNGYSPLSNVFTGNRYHPESVNYGDVTDGTWCDDGLPSEGACPHQDCHHAQGILVAVLGPVN